jgi:hypothetical protein
VTHALERDHGLPAEPIRRWLRGETTLRSDALARLLDALGMAVAPSD